MNDYKNPFQAPELDRKARMEYARRRRKLQNIAMGLGVALFAFILFCLPGIFRTLRKLLFEKQRRLKSQSSFTKPLCVGVGGFLKKDKGMSRD